MRIILLGSYIFAGGIFGFLSIAWLLEGETDEASKCFLGFLGFSALTYTYFKLTQSNSKHEQKWIDEQVKKYNIKNKKFILLGNTINGHLIYDKQRLIFMNPYVKKTDVININKVLDIKIEVIENVKNVKRAIALTSTYDQISKIDSIKMIIITDIGTYTIICDNGDLNNKLNDIERYKLILEKDIRKFNNTSM